MAEVDSEEDIKRELLSRALEESELVYAINDTATELKIESKSVKDCFVKLFNEGKIEVYRYGKSKEKQFVCLSLDEALDGYKDMNYCIFVCLSAK